MANTSDRQNCAECSLRRAKAKRVVRQAQLTVINAKRLSLLEAALVATDVNEH